MKLITIYFLIGVLSYCSGAKNQPIPAPIAFYDEIKALPNHPEKLLIDVREPAELQETGRIPTSINVPCKFFFSRTFLYSKHTIYGQAGNFLMKKFVFVISGRS